ncbi:unnamed protein product [Amoebophrya sp. A120]|nr:unnamed protein product [Amoebophrya sp. A120]|eukprot:GSA120T00021585001.1
MLQFCCTGGSILAGRLLVATVGSVVPIAILSGQLVGVSALRLRTGSPRAGGAASASTSTAEEDDDLRPHAAGENVGTNIRTDEHAHTPEREGGNGQAVRLEDEEPETEHPLPVGENTQEDTHQEQDNATSEDIVTASWFWDAFGLGDNTSSNSIEEPFRVMTLDGPKAVLNSDCPICLTELRGTSGVESGGALECHEEQAGTRGERPEQLSSAWVFRCEHMLCTACYRLCMSNIIPSGAPASASASASSTTSQDVTTTGNNHAPGDHHHHDPGDPMPVTATAQMTAHDQQHADHPPVAPSYASSSFSSSGEEGVDEHQGLVVSPRQSGRALAQHHISTLLSRGMLYNARSRRLEPKCPLCRSEDGIWFDGESLENVLDQYPPEDVMPALLRSPAITVINNQNPILDAGTGPEAYGNLAAWAYGTSFSSASRPRETTFQNCPRQCMVAESCTPSLRRLLSACTSCGSRGSM